MVQGVVKDGNDYQSELPGVNIYRGESPTNSSDVFGRFRIKVKVGDIITFRYIDYDIETITITDKSEWVVYLFEQGKRRTKKSHKITTHATTQGGAVAELGPIKEFDGFNGIFSPDGNKVLTVSGAHNQFWDIGSKVMVIDSRMNLNELRYASFSPEGRREWAPVAYSARVYDLDGKLNQILIGHTDEALCAAYSKDGGKILTGSKDGTARLWDLNGKTLAIFKGHTDSVRSVVFSPDGTKVLTASYDNTCRLWDLNGRTLAIFHGHTNVIMSAVFSADGTRVLTASDDKTGRLWDLRGQTIVTLKGHTSNVYSAVFSPDGTKILTASGDKTARLWDLNGQTLVTFDGHTSDVFSAIFSLDGTKVLTASWDKTARLWDVNGRKPLILQGHSSGVMSAVFSADGKKILTASDDQTACLRDNQGDTLAILLGQKDRINSAIFSPDGTKVLTASRECKARLLVLPVNLRSPVAVTIAPKPKFPPNLILDNLAITGIGNNNILDGGETATITATLRNSGKGTAYGLAPSLTSDYPGLSAKGKTISTLEPGASTSLRFEVNTQPELKHGKVLFSLAVKEQNDFDADPVNLSVTTAPFKAPAPQLVAHQFLAEGNTVRKGLAVMLKCIVQNMSTTTAKAVNVEFIVPKNTFSAGESTFQLGDLAAGDKREVLFEFFTNKSFAEPVLTITGKVTEATELYGMNKQMTVAINGTVATAKSVDITPIHSETPTIAAASLTSDVDNEIPQAKGGPLANRFALVIGNEDYRRYQSSASGGESNVAFAVADAVSFSQYATKVLRVPQDQVFLLQNGTLADMKTELETFVKLINLKNEKAEIVFFYSGHGLPHPTTKKPVLLPVDLPANKAAQALEIQTIAESLASTPHSRILMFVDACFSGVGKGGTNLLAQKGTRIVPASSGLAGNTVLITSSSADQPSEIYNEQYHGFFTYHLLKGIKSKSASPLNTKEIFEYLKVKVPESTIKIKRVEQTPTLQASPAVGNAWEGWTW